MVDNINENLGWESVGKQKGTKGEKFGATTPGSVSQKTCLGHEHNLREDIME